MADGARAYPPGLLIALPVNRNFTDLGVIPCGYNAGDGAFAADGRYIEGCNGVLIAWAQLRTRNCFRLVASVPWSRSAKDSTKTTPSVPPENAKKMVLIFLTFVKEISLKTASFPNSRISQNEKIINKNSIALITRKLGCRRNFVIISEIGKRIGIPRTRADSPNDNRNIVKRRI